MGAIKKIESYILPHEVDFFSRLQDQAVMTKKIIDELQTVHIAHIGTPTTSLISMMHEAEEMRKKNLEELYGVFITPVDNESISRAYINLDWVVMSVKHLEVELEIYGLQDLSEYKPIIELLSEEMGEMHSGFGMLREKTREKTSEPVFKIVHYDNEVVKGYATMVSTLAMGSDIRKITICKGILDQLKEISKRIRMCANDLEDMLFKMR